MIESKSKMRVLKRTNSVFLVLLLLDIPFKLEAQIREDLSTRMGSRTWLGRSWSGTNSQDIVKRVGQWGWGPCYCVAVKGNYAFIGNGAMMQVLDVSDPSKAVPVGQLLTDGPIRKIVVAGNYAYTLAPFRIIDISIPTAPCLLSTYSFSGPPPTQIVVTGSYAYIGDLSGTVLIFDVSNPFQPKMVNSPTSISLSGQNTTAMAIRGNYLYGSSYDGQALDIYDISDAAHPTSVSHLSDLGGATTLAILGDYLFAGYASREFRMYDLRDPSSPRFVNGLRLTASPNAISVINLRAFVSLDSAGFAVLDISDTSNIKLIGGIPFPYPHGLAYQPHFGPIAQCVSSTEAYLSTSLGLWIVDVKNPPILKTMSFFPTAWGARKIVIDSLQHAFFAELWAGLKILDLSNASSPQLIGQYISNESVRDVGISTNLALLLCDSDIVVLDISNPKEPQLVSKLAFGDTLNDNNGFGADGCLSVNGSTVYVARTSNRFFVIDISDPRQPRMISNLPTPGVCVGICRSGQYLYLAIADVGIQIVSISSPSSPQDIALLQISPLRGIATADSILVIEGGKSSQLGKIAFSRYDITDPATPILRYSLNVPGGVLVSNISLDQKFAYVANNGSFVIIDISSEDTGKIVYSADKNIFGAFYDYWGVGTVNGEILLGVGDQGVLILKNTLDTHFPSSSEYANPLELFQNFPNPFNSTTMIAYHLPVDGNVTLKVYDMLGREVKTLVKGFMQAGEHCVDFSEGRLSSGVYVYKVSVNGQSLCKKMMVLR